MQSSFLELRVEFCWQLHRWKLRRPTESRKLASLYSAWGTRLYVTKASQKSRGLKPGKASFLKVGGSFSANSQFQNAITCSGQGFSTTKPNHFFALALHNWHMDFSSCVPARLCFAFDCSSPGDPMGDNPVGGPWDLPRNVKARAWALPRVKANFHLYLHM